MDGIIFSGTAGMITLIGHGYVGKHIAMELSYQKINFKWIRHTETIPAGTESIINAAGYTGYPNVDACELNKEETLDGNVVWPLTLERGYRGIPIVHITSGCIYSGYAKDYTEEDKPNFNFQNGSFYSGSKALGQKLLMPFMNKSYLLRIRMPFGDEHNPKNLLTKYKQYDKLISMPNSLSYMPDVARFAWYCADKEREVPTGIYNVCNPGYSDAESIARMMGLQKEFFSSYEDFNEMVVAPRSNCILDTKKIQSVYPIQNLETALSMAIRKIDGLI